MINKRIFTNKKPPGEIEYAPKYNPSKGRRFRGRYDAQGNFHDIDDEEMHQDLPDLMIK